MSTITAKNHDRKYYSAGAIRSIDIPDSKLCRRITELVRDTESDLLFNHSSRVYCFAALTGLRRGLPFDRELLYAGAMFHDMGLTTRHSSRTERFEVDGANVARDFLRAHHIAPSDIDLVPLHRGFDWLRGGWSAPMPVGSGPPRMDSFSWFRDRPVWASSRGIADVAGGSDFQSVRSERAGDVRQFVQSTTRELLRWVKEFA